MPETVWFFKDGDWHQVAGGSGGGTVLWEDVGTGAGSGGSGTDEPGEISFDVSNTGNWLFVQTTNNATSPDGVGIELKDTSGFIWIQSTGDIDIDAADSISLHSAGATLQMSSLGDIRLTPAANRLIKLDASGISGGATYSGSKGVWVSSPHGAMILQETSFAFEAQLNANGNAKAKPVNVYVTGDQGNDSSFVEIGLTNSGTFDSSNFCRYGVADGITEVIVYGSFGKYEVNGGGSVPLLRVTGDGTYHIKSGASWVADL